MTEPVAPVYPWDSMNLDFSKAKLSDSPAPSSSTQPSDSARGGIDVTPKVKTSASAMDIAKEVGASAVDSVGNALQAGGEVVAAGLNKALDTEDFRTENILKPVSDAMRDSMTEGGKQGRKDASWEGDGFEALAGDWSKIKTPESMDGYLMTAANGFGSMAGMFIPMLGWAKKAQTVGRTLEIATKAAEASKIAAATGDAAAVAAAAADAAKVTELTSALKTISRNSRIAGATSEGSMTGGNAADQERTEAETKVNSMTHEQLMAEVPTYATAYQHYGNESQARQAVVNNAARLAGGISALAGAAGGAFNSKIFEDVFMDKGVSKALGGISGSRVVRAGLGATAGSATEGLQEGLEQVGQNVGENIAFGRPAGENATRDTFGQMVGGAMVGGPMGAAGGAVSKHHAAPAIAPVDPALAPVALKANEANTPLSKAAIAGNVGPLAAAANAQGVAEKAAKAAVPVDPLAERAASVTAALRQPGALDSLRAEGSPIDAKRAVNDLAIVQSTSTPAGAREQALGRLEFAMEWASVKPAAQETAAPTYDSQPAADQRAVADQAQQASNDQAAAKAAPLPPADAVIAAMQVVPALRTAEQSALVKQAAARYTPEQTALLTQAATYAAGMTAEQRIQLAALRAGPAPIERAAESPVATPATEQNLGAAVPNSGTNEAFVAPTALTPAGPGPAVHRRRAATLAQLAQMGFNTVEKRADGFYLTGGKKDFKLDGPADAQLARKVIKDHVDVSAHEAATSPLNDRPQPTDKQIEGSDGRARYKKGAKFQMNGQTVVIENPDGSTRRSKPGAATQWETDMRGHYGDLAGTIGADGDPVDVFIGPRPDTHKIFVIDQVNSDGKFDEHKVMMGYTSEAAARAGYLANYETGWNGLGAITQMAASDFNTWVHSDATSKPMGDINGHPGSNPIAAASSGTEGANPDAAAGVASGEPGPSARDAQPGDGATGSSAAADGGPAPAADAGVRPGTVITVQVGGSPVALTIVEPTGSKSKARPGNAAPVTAGAAKLLRTIASGFGKQVVFYASTKGVGDGFTIPGNSNHIFISESTSINPMAVFGHELMHLVAEDMPQVHAALVKVVEARLGADAAHKFRNDYHSADMQNGPLSNAALGKADLDEITSDIGGNLLSDASFWRDVFAQVEQDNPGVSKGLIAQLAAKFYALIDKLVKAVKGPQFRSTDLVTDMDGVRAAFKDGLAKYVAAAHLSPVGMQAEILRATTKEAKQSTSRYSGASLVHDDRSSESSPSDEDVKRSAARPGRDEDGNLGGLPTRVEIKGIGEIDVGHWNPAEQVARDYTAAAGIQYNPPSEFVKVDRERALRIAKAYDEMQHSPHDPDVKAAYAALIDEVTAQYAAVIKSGLNVEFIDFEKTGDPYAASPRLATEDVRNNSHFWVFSTRDGYGTSDFNVSDNPMLSETSHEISGKKALANDLFRIVHDYFGHVKEGVGFRADGEENAWRAHSAMFSPLARKALTSETRGQNSWVNYGPHGEANRTASGSDTHYADQKVGLLPQWAVDDGVGDVRDNAPDEPGHARAVTSEAGSDDGTSARYGAPQDGASSVVGYHFSKTPRKSLDANRYGTGYKGLEAERLSGSENADIRPRTFFYADKGNGIRAEDGVGAYAHRVQLNNLYDVRKDALGIVRRNPGANNWERAVMRAGFDGYLNMDPLLSQGFAVLLGKQHDAVPVEQIKAPGYSDPATAEPETLKKGLMSKELASVEVSNIPGATLKSGTLTVPVEGREAANTELERIGSNVRFSNERINDSAEYDAVVAKHKGTESWMKAPNGEATKLNERQWVHVRTPAFKAWFGDWESKKDSSRVMHTNGEPLVVYHGTDDGGFSEFKKPGGEKRGDVGIFTSDNWEVARSYVNSRSGQKAMTEAEIATFNEDGEKVGGIYAMFMNLRSPSEDDFEGAHWTGDRYDQFNVILDGRTEPYTNSSGQRNFDADTAAEIAEEKGGSVEPAESHWTTTDGAVREARRMGDDGSIIRDVVDYGSGWDGYAPSDVFIAFDPAQLKSADFNNGSYSLESNDIRQTASRPKQDPAIGDRTDVAKMPKGRVIPESAAVGSLENSLELARSKSYTKGRQLKVDIQARVLAASKAAKVNLSARTRETFKFLSGMVVQDAKLALKSNENAIGWYDKTVSRAIGAMSTLHPEIETDPRARLAFLWALATTSNGLKVGINFQIAEETYRTWKETGVMPADAGIGNSKSSIDKGLALYNSLREKMGDDRLFRFMATEFEAGQIERMLGEAPGGEWAGTPVLGSAVLGPKIGNGFFSNLNGYFSALTMDRWLMRTWGRMTGTLLEVLPETVVKSRTKLANSIASMSDSERKLMSKLIGTSLRRSMTRAELDAVSLAVQKTAMKPEKREIMSATPATDRLRLDGNGHAKILDGQKEAPAGPAERNWIRAVFTQALTELNSGDKAMTMSDLQALLWYPERRLYDAAKSDEDVADGYEDDEAPDYANAAREIALKNGISAAEISAAMDRAEKRGTVKGQSLTEDEKTAMLKGFRASPKQSVHLAFEVAPDPADAELVAQWGALSMKDKTRITAMAKDSVMGDLVDAVGANVTKTVGATGAYKGLINPNLITEYAHTKVPIEQARALAAAIGMALGQDSVALVDPRAADTNGLVRITLNTKVEKHAAALLAAIQTQVPEIDGFTARGNNFDVLNFTGMTTEELAGKITEAMKGMSADLEAAISHGDTQSELVEKGNYESHIQGLRPGAGEEILGRVERARDRAREIVAQEIRSAGEAGLDRGARKGAGRAAAARRDDVGQVTGDVKQSAARARDEIVNGAASIAAMSQDERENLDPAQAPGGWDAYVYHEALLKAPKPSDKLKRVTESNSFILHQEADYVANVDGELFAVSKQEDPDEPDDETKFVYAFSKLAEPNAQAISSMTDQVDELFKQMRASKDITKSTSRPIFVSQLEVAIESVPERLSTMAAAQWKLWLDANAGKLGVKKDEVEWSGVKDYLALRGKDKVTRDELMLAVTSTTNAQAAVRMYASGMRQVQIAKQLNVHPSNVVEYLDRAGVVRRAKNYASEAKAEAVRLYLSGLSVGRVGSAVGVSRSSVQNWLKESGVEPRREKRVPISDGVRDEALRLYVDEEMSSAEVAGRMGISVSSVAEMIRESGVSRSVGEGRAIFIRKNGRPDTRGRSIPWQSEKTGEWNFADSSYEIVRMSQLDSDNSVAYWGRSKLRIPYGDGKIYSPDLQVEYKDGRVEVEEIKPLWQVDSDAVVSKAKAASEYLGERGIGYRLVTEDDIGRDELAAFDFKSIPLLSEDERADRKRERDSERSKRMRTELNEQARDRYAKRRAEIRQINADSEGAPQPLFSAARPLADLNIGSGYKLADLFKTSKSMTVWQKTVGTMFHAAEKHPEFKRTYDAVQHFLSDVSLYAARSADLAPNILIKMDGFKDILKSPLSAKDVESLKSPVFEGTLNYARNDKGVAVLEPDVGKAGIVWTDDELRSKWGLDDRLIGIYREFRKTTNRSLAYLSKSDMLRYLGKDGVAIRTAVMDAPGMKAATELIENHLAELAAASPARADLLQNTAQTIREKANTVQGLMAKGYAPLSRFGKFSVYATEKDGTPISFTMHETERDANKHEREMKAAFPEANVEAGIMSQEQFKLFSGVTPETLGLLGEALGLEEGADSQQSQVFDTLIKLTKNNRSAMKRLIERKGINGFSQDVGRVLAGFVYSNSRQTSTNLNMGEVSKSAADIPKEHGDVKDMAIKLVDYIKHPSEEVQAIKGLLFTQMIGGSLASAVVNATQPWIMTMPYLSQFDGIAGSMTRMAAALKMAVGKSTGDPVLDAAIKQAEDEGVISPQEVHQLMAQAQGKATLQSGDGTAMGDLRAKANNTLSKIALAWGQPFSIAEQFNRRLTFIAAYKLAVDKGMTDPMAFAEKAIAETQGVFNRGNRPAWARGTVGSIAFTFKQYSIAYCEFLQRMYGNGPEGKKAVAFALLMMLMSAGLGGLPGADNVDDIVDGIMQQVFKRSFSSKQEKHEFLMEKLGLGQTMTDFIMHGVSGLPGAPMDVSGRLGLGKLFPATGLLAKKSDHTSDVVELGGPAASFVKQGYESAAMVAAGNPIDAFLHMSPLAIQNLLKAKDMADMGMYRDMKGRKVIDTDAIDVAIKAFGFQPSAVKRVQDATGIEQNLVDQNRMRKNEITDLLSAGRIERDPEKTAQGKQLLADWNAANPDSHIAVDSSAINKRVQEAMKDKAKRISEASPKGIRAAVKSDLAAADLAK
jgi:transposase-like protein